MEPNGRPKRAVSDQDKSMRLSLSIDRPRASHEHGRNSSLTSLDFSSLHATWTNSDGFLGSSVLSSSTQSVPLTTEPRKTGTSSAIHDAARITDWDRVLELCQTQPEAAAYLGRDGWTALHHACNRRCPRPDVVEALIRAHPQALLQEVDKLWLPLHFAARFKCQVEIIDLLLTIFPESGKVAVAKRDNKGRRPLYYAIRYDAPPGVASRLIEADPSAVLDEDQNDESPLALVWNTWAEKGEGKRIVHSFLPGGFPEPNDTSVDERAQQLRERLHKEEKLLNRWNRVNMLLRAAFGFPFHDLDLNEATPDDNGRKWRIVHATAAVKCHLSLFLLASALHPEQARELDEGDLYGVAKSRQTALHLAASSNAGTDPGKTVIYNLLNLYREAAEIQDEIDGSLPLHRMVENPRKQDWPNHAAILYHFYPRAGQIQDLNGKLPLHRAAAAITHQDHDGDQERSVIFQLVRSYPQAAGVVDNDSQVPLHYICRNGRVWDEDVASVFNAHTPAVQMRVRGYLPLHMAAANPLSEESLIGKLLQHHPRAAGMPDPTGKLALHLACELGKDWKAGTRSLHEAHPEAVRSPEANERGWYALHMACDCDKSSGELITKLVELFPEAAAHMDTQKRYPLHLACQSEKSWHDGLSVVFDACPYALSYPDAEGLLPWQRLALRYCRKDDVSGPTTKAVPKIEAQKEQSVSTEEAAELDILFNIIRADPTTLQ